MLNEVDQYYFKGENRGKEIIFMFADSNPINNPRVFINGKRPCGTPTVNGNTLTIPFHNKDGKYFFFIQYDDTDEMKQTMFLVRIRTKLPIKH